MENARTIIDAVKPKAAKFSYEMMPHMLPDCGARYLRLIEAIDRPAFGVHLDLVNVINSPERAYDTTAVIEQCVDELGPHVVSCHLKDIMLEDDITVRFREVPLGNGLFDVGSYLKKSPPSSAAAGDVGAPVHSHGIRASARRMRRRSRRGPGDLHRGLISQIPRPVSREATRQEPRPGLAPA